MIITQANDSVSEVHDRMPVILEPPDFDAWLDQNRGVGIAHPGGQ